VDCTSQFLDESVAFSYHLAWESTTGLGCHLASFLFFSRSFPGPFEDAAGNTADDETVRAMCAPQLVPRSKLRRTERRCAVVLPPQAKGERESIQ